jgi:LysR family transcriptional regulator, nitrogen assimilation regulatory protein
MRLRQLESFITVCELGSISRAAERLHVAQPALGLQLRGLEDELGAQLVERHARGVEPTPAGLIALDWARQTLAGIRAVKEQLRSLSTGLTGPVTLGLTPSAATAFALPILLAAQRELPNLRLHLAEAVGHVLKEWVQAGRVDLALVFDAAGTENDSQQLLTERLYFVTASGGPVGSAGPITMAEALEQPLAMSAASDSLRKSVEAAARDLGVALRIEFQVQSIAVILKLVRSGIASTVLPMPMVMDGVRDGTLVARRIEAPALARYLRWAVSEASPQLAAVREVQRLAEQVVRQGSTDPLLREAYELGALR